MAGCSNLGLEQITKAVSHLDRAGHISRAPQAPADRRTLRPISADASPRGSTQMGTTDKARPSRRVAGIGQWLTGGRAGGSRHRDVQGGTQRATVLGIAGASTNASAVRLAGVAGLLAGAFSMAAGELVSVRAQQEMVEREVAVERQELADDPAGETRELAGMYQAQGLSAEDAHTVARILSTNPDIALDTHARLELGIDPQAPGSAWRAATSSFLAFSVGAILPLFPWFFTQGTGAVIASVII